MSEQKQAMGGMRVKPLEWECVGWSGGSGVQGEDDDAWEAQTGQSSLCYRIDWFGVDKFRLETPDEIATPAYHPTLEDAKAAAQADYTARILAALDLAPVVALVEAGQPILDMLMFTESA